MEEIDIWDLAREELYPEDEEDYEEFESCLFSSYDLLSTYIQGFEKAKEIYEIK